MNFIGWATAAAVATTATTAIAQPLPREAAMRPPIAEVSDLDGPYAAVPPPRLRRPLPERGYAPEADLAEVLAPSEIAAIARDAGFEPLGIPRQRGLVYTLAAINPDGDDGRLVIDARSGRLVRFMPALQMGDAMEEVTVASYGRIQGLPRFVERNPPRPPRPVTHLATRHSATPLPRPAPQPPVGAKAATAGTDAPKPGLDQPSATSDAAKRETAAAQPRPSAVPSAAGPAPAEAKPSGEIKPTEAMPPVQGLE